jgi:transcriptional regulator with XRE-family HTH domain
MLLAAVPLGAYCCHMALKIDADAVRGLREQNGWTVRKFADKAELDHSFVSKIERGLAPRPSPKSVLKIAQALGVHHDAITGDKQMYAAALEEARTSPRALRPKTAAAA